jgi:hypothetical protein
MPCSSWVRPLWSIPASASLRLPRAAASQSLPSTSVGRAQTICWRSRWKTAARWLCRSCCRSCDRPYGQHCRPRCRWSIPDPIDSGSSTSSTLRSDHAYCCGLSALAEVPHTTTVRGDAGSRDEEEQLGRLTDHLIDDVCQRDYREDRRYEEGDPNRRRHSGQPVSVAPTRRLASGKRD